MPLPSAPAAVPADPARARATRLEARLAVYAQYAAVVAEQATATVAGDEGRLELLAAERERVAEHFDELRAPAGEVGPGAASFRAALDDALAELAHQGAVDAALGARLAALRDAVLRGAAWGAPAEAPVPPLRMLSGPVTAGPPADAGAPNARPDPTADAADGELAADPVDAVLGGALVAARAAGVGGTLGGQYPGRAARDDYPAGRHAEGPADVAPDGPRFDIRF
jgi:hypothetical protein